MEFIPLLVAVIALMTLSAICSGLNIALLSMDLGTLERKAKLGDKRAEHALPFRKNVHLTLASVLLANVAAAAALPLVLNTAFGSIAAGAVSTVLLVIFGEILPQAIFAKHALALYAYLRIPLQIMIIITYPLSKPLQLALDKLVGAHGVQLHSRHELGIMIAEHLTDDTSDLDEDEVEIIRGALQLSEKRVSSIMTPISTTYWLTPDTLIDASKIDEIKAAGRSRIPIFNHKKTICYGVVLMKDMVDIDFDNSPVLVKELPIYVSKTVGTKTALDTLFKKFISAQSHLLPVEKDGKIVGIVTIEDLLEEIIGHEIRDESDRASKRA